jgi:hypothetical protein
MQPVNRRKRRVRRKIGGLRHGPLGFGLLPKRCAFETERPVDSSTCKMFGIRPAGKCAAVNKNGVASWDGRMLAPLSQPSSNPRRGVRGVMPSTG